MSVPAILVCSSFLISVYVFIVSKALLILSATVIVREGGVILVEPPLLQCCLMCVVPSLYSVVFCTRVAWVCLVCLLLCKVECSSLSSVFTITERRDMGLYEVPLFVSLLGFGIGTMLANFHV